MIKLLTDLWRECTICAVISLGKKPFALNRKNEGREEVLVIGKS